MRRVRVSSQQLPVYKLGDSQMTLTPKFRLAVKQSPLLDPSLDVLDIDLSLSGEPLIPGLPDDIALNCLLRLPVASHSSCKSVCKRWHLVLGSKERFFTARMKFGFRDPWLFVFAFDKCVGKMQWQVLDLTQFTWHSIPAMPCKDRVCVHGFRSISVPNIGSLFVFGDVVLKYEIQRNRWTVMKSMITARSFFASGVIDGMIYVAGGNSMDLFELDSAETMDPFKNSWRPIAKMGTNIACYDSSVLNGKFLVTEGWLWPFYVSPRGQIYDPTTNNWGNMPDGLREGWTGSSVVIHDHLFVVSEHERMNVKVYYSDTDSWEKIDGPPLPDKIRKPFSVNGYSNNVYVVGRNLHVAVGHVVRHRAGKEESSCGKKWRFSVRWSVVEAPKGFLDWAPSSSQVLLA